MEDLRPFGIFYGHLVYFSVLVCCGKKNLATPNRNFETAKTFHSENTFFVCAQVANKKKVEDRDFVVNLVDTTGLTKCNLPSTQNHNVKCSLECFMNLQKYTLG
jgi:hypothetical protein